MDEAEFDKHALAYEDQLRENIAITGEDPTFFAEYKIKLFSKWAQSKPRSVMDFGSGIGNSIPYFRKHFAESEITCADVSQKSLAYASRRFPGRERSLIITQEGIPAADQSFDAAFSACVFHHIPHEEHGFWLKELIRVVRPGGTIAIFEHNPFNPLTVYAVSTCPFDQNARLVRAHSLQARCRKAGWQVLRTSYHVFFPRFAAALRVVEPLIGWMPLGAQYSVLAKRPS
jgi:ubiquinone/menaquinone biosynthesis C-methylase UbiE